MVSPRVLEEPSILGQREASENPGRSVVEILFPPPAQCGERDTGERQRRSNEPHTSGGVPRPNQVREHVYADLRGFENLGRGESCKGVGGVESMCVSTLALGLLPERNAPSQGMISPGSRRGVSPTSRFLTLMTCSSLDDQSIVGG